MQPRSADQPTPCGLCFWYGSVPGAARCHNACRPNFYNCSGTQAGASADVEDESGAKPIHAAVGMGNDEIVALLLPHTKDVTAMSLERQKRSQGVDMLPPGPSPTAASMAYALYYFLVLLL